MTQPTITHGDLADALLWVSAGGFGEQQAWFCRDTGKVHYRSDFDDNGEDLPDDIDDTTRYLALPGKRDLDLGTPWHCSSRESNCRVSTTTFATSSITATPTRATRPCWKNATH